MDLPTFLFYSAIPSGITAGLLWSWIRNLGAAPVYGNVKTLTNAERLFFRVFIPSLISWVTYLSVGLICWLR